MRKGGGGRAQAWPPDPAREGVRRLFKRQDGVAMVEATIGTILLLLAALGTIQLVLVFHGALASYGAVIRASRTYAITRETSDADKTFNVQMGTALKALTWTGFRCYMNGTAATCEVSVTIPSVLPGAGVFTGNSVMGPITIHQTGVYPYGEHSAN